MAAMNTALTEFADNGNSRTYTTAGHTAVKPKLVIQKRTVPVNGTSVAESTISVVHASDDPDGKVLPQKVSMSVSIRYPSNCTAQDIQDVQTIFRDIIAGDEFAETVNTQNWLT